MIQLNLAKNNEKVTIVKLNVQDSEKKHLEDMGFVPNASLFVISNHDGDMICYLKESRLAITKNVAKNIMVNIKNQKHDYI